MERRSRVCCIGTARRWWLAPLQAGCAAGEGEGRAEEGHGDEPSPPPAQGNDDGYFPWLFCCISA